MSDQANDLIAWFNTLAMERQPFETVWADCIALSLPMHPEIYPGTPMAAAAANRILMGPKSEERGRKLYDSVGVMAVDRLSSGMESLVTPQSEKWHGLECDDVFSSNQTAEEDEYFEAYRDYLFKIRYDNRSGFLNSHQKAIRSAVALGDGVTFVEECFGLHGVAAKRVPIRYTYCPLHECFMAKDRYGVHNVMFRLYSRSAIQALQQFKEKTPQKIRECAENAKDRQRQFTIVHAVYPRNFEDDTGEDYGTDNIKRSPFISQYLLLEEREIVTQSGFFEFPYTVYTWHDGERGYGESAIMLALAELKGLQVMGKTGLRVHQQLADPPLAIAHDGVMNRPNLNPRAFNPGALTETGELRIKPIVTPQLPQVFNEYLMGKREAVNDMLYIKMFQILVQHPGMTATEALIRANEKGELLGPAGSKIQQGLSNLIDRETGILKRKGIYLPGSPMQPPQSLSRRGASFGPKFTSPLDRLRRASELLGIQRTLEISTPLAAIDPEIKDNFDGDEIVRMARDITGAPAKMLKRPDDVAKIRDARNAALAQQNNTRAAGEAGDATVKAAQGLDAMHNIARKVAPTIAAGMVNKGPQAPPAPGGPASGGAPILPPAPIAWPSAAPGVP